MRRAVLLIVLLVVVTAGTLVRTQSSAASAAPNGATRVAGIADWWHNVERYAQRQTTPLRAPDPQVPIVSTSAVSLTTVADWERGSFSGLLVSNNSGGELRLADGSREGTFVSDLFKPTTLFNAVGAVWRADVPAGAHLRLEVRGGTTSAEADQTAWQTLASGDALSSDGALALESVQPFPAGLQFLQFRATFSSNQNNASPVLNDIALIALNSTQGPPRSASARRVPAPFGPATLTTPPTIVLRETWGAPPPALATVREPPRGIILHQIGSDDVVDSLQFLRALAAYDIDILGWDDMPFHFVIDREGTIFAGRNGGPTSQVTRFAGGDTAVHVALIAGTAPTDAQRSSLTNLLAWLGQAYEIAPTGQHPVVSGGQTAQQPNIVAHGAIVPEAADVSEAFKSLAEGVRQAADRATVRARWYFAEGNPFSFAERLTALNPSGSAASVRFSLLRQPGPSVIRDTDVAAGTRADLVVNDLFNDTSDVPAVIESNAPVIAERFMNFGADITASPGVRQPSRVWYFAEGSTANESKTYLLLFNPQATTVSGTVTYMLDDGRTAEQRVQIAPQQRVVVTVGDALPNQTFGARVIASQPIVAERTMIFGPGSTPTTGGVTTTPGVVTLSRRWYFAEGTTQSPFQMSILVLNPNAQPTNVAVTFLTDSGTSLTRRYAIPATTRLAINVNEVVPELGIATTVVADRPVAVERAMYWSNTGATGVFGMANPGAIQPGFTWRFADGRTSDGFQEYLLLSNPNKNPARVAVDFILADGRTETQTLPLLAPGSRYTMAVHQYYANQVAISATVRSTQPIVAERALYAGAPNTAANRGGASALGVPGDSQ